MKGRHPKSASEKSEVRIFVSYSHVDDAVRAKLETHLATLKRDGVSTWYDGDLTAGDSLRRGIARELRRAHLFVALLSPDYIASHYCWKLEYQRAMNRRARGAMQVVALIVRPCDWRATRAAGFKLLPADGRPVSRWRSADDALLDAAQGIRKAVLSIRKAIAASNRAAPVGPSKRAIAKPGKLRRGGTTASAKPAKRVGAKPVKRGKGPTRPVSRR